MIAIFQLNITKLKNSNMKNLITTSILLCFIILPLISAAQNYIYVGTKQYDALDDWKFGGLNVVFAKSSSNSGILFIEGRESQFKTERFGTDLIIYLKNGKQLVLSPRIAYDRLDGNISAAYSVSAINLIQLKNFDIFKIRFSVIDQMFGNVDNYTALNERSEYKTMKVPAPEAEHMTEMERMRKNIESESLGIDRSDIFERPKKYYYKYETFKVASHSVPTSTLIRAFYE